MQATCPKCSHESTSDIFRTTYLKRASPYSLRLCDGYRVVYEANTIPELCKFAEKHFSPKHRIEQKTYTGQYQPLHTDKVPVTKPLRKKRIRVKVRVT